MSTHVNRWSVALMYAFCVVVWGTTYYAYRGQVGFVAADVSLLYRLVIAGGLFACISMLQGGNRNLCLTDHLSLAGFGLCNFFLAYFLLYRATELVVSAIVVIVFSTKAVWTPIATRIFLKRKTHPLVLLGGLVGVAGIAVIVWPAENNTTFSADGTLLALAGTLVTSMGDVFSTRNSAEGIAPAQANKWGMAYAILGAFFFIVVQGHSFALPKAGPYWASVLWLAVAASLVAWTFYLRLVAALGAETTSMMVLLFPVVGVVASALFEGLKITPRLAVGAGIVLVANSLALLSTRLVPVVRRTRRLTNDLEVCGGLKA